ncbi:MAG TPA: hypothetical protein VNW54_15025 [Granulicella sp.]|jgi:hypothetical protein|nr:hypothetical protein [Granulicella sp.]
MTGVEERLKRLQLLDFEGKGEPFVESNFLTPLLECLGYETHKDYEVRRHGDDGTSFKLRYPPVEKGARKVRHYNPDYMPTIRKKMFWVIEAKSPKDVVAPFDLQYLVQGLQYCIHPEIQAPYLLVTNGLVSSVFDAHASVFLDSDVYKPVLEFRADELATRWTEIYELLAVAKIRHRIEEQLKVIYDKLCLSSLDKDYPAALIKRIGANSGENAKTIARTVNRLFVEGMEREKAEWVEYMNGLDLDATYASMNDPAAPGHTQVHFVLTKSREHGNTDSEIFRRLTHDFDRQNIFRKVQSFHAVAILFLKTSDLAVTIAAEEFLQTYKEADLPLLNQVECALLRLTRKRNVLFVYPALRPKIAKALELTPEIERYVDPPNSYSLTCAGEVNQHHRSFEILKTLPKEQLASLLTLFLDAEAKINDEFWNARKSLADTEKQILGFEIYGDNGRHYAFKGILGNLGIKFEERDAASSK